MHILASFVLALLIPVAAFASDAGITRRDGFLLIWESVNRPATEQWYPEFDDVPEEDRGFTEISYAADRGILDEASHFYPDAVLTKGDAVLWLMRTRNVADPDDIERSDLSGLLARYPIIAFANREDSIASQAQLTELIQLFDEMLRNEIHEVSYYADDFQGAGTAFGETFNMHEITAAHRTFPYNTLVRVTNMETGASVVVRINDRGPYVHGRSMDLSLAAFETIAERSRGVLRNVRLERLGDVSLVDAEGSQIEIPPTENPEQIEIKADPNMRYQKRITRDVRFHRGIPLRAKVGQHLALGSTKFFVIRSVMYPDGFVQLRQQWIDTDERFTFTPGITGVYRFQIGTGFGKSREFTMRVDN